MALGKESVLMLGELPEIFMTNDCDTLPCGKKESTTWMVNVDCCCAVGVPEIVPVELNVNPAGSVQFNEYL